MKTAVVYWSGTGNTEAMAKAVVEGMTAAASAASVRRCSAPTAGATVSGCEAGRRTALTRG